MPRSNSPLRPVDDLAPPCVINIEIAAARTGFVIEIEPAVVAELAYRILANLVLGRTNIHGICRKMPEPEKVRCNTLDSISKTLALCRHPAENIQSHAL